MTEAISRLGTLAELSTYRAVDNQIFVAMCSPARDITAEYHAVRNECSFLDALTIAAVAAAAASGATRWSSTRCKLKLLHEIVTDCERLQWQGAD